MAGTGVRPLSREPLTLPGLLPPLPAEALHARVARTLRGAVSEGALPGGTRLPGHRALAQALGVSRNTLVDALAQLEAEGYVEARGRSGTRVLLPVLDLPGTGSAPAPRLPLSAWAERALAGQLEDAGGDYATDFRVGQPVPELYPARAWAQALARRAAQPLTGSGGDDPLGPLDTRRALAAHLRAERGAQVTPEMLMLTGGTQPALDALARLFLEPGRVAAAEVPTYPAALAALSATGAEVRGVPVDGGGLCPEALPPQASLLYLTPGCQYPTTVTLGAARRREVLAWARGAGAYLLEDDYAADLHHTGRAPTVMQGLAPERVILLGSFSKSLAPVTRSGFVAAPPEVLRVLAATRPLTDRFPGTLDALALADLLASGGYARHLRRARQALAHRHDVLLAALTNLLPGWQPRPARAGLHLYVTLPPGLSAPAAQAGARAVGVALSPVSGPGQAGVLLAYAHLPPEAIRAGVGRLARQFA
ncbi:PLP-dependent aminotransferase family protein [Deinococcus gobiensis]|uniref:MocR protein n=1 Tax=Deinococcus gobiensis (strain DSM 21396 / JCM 16679 / CGMCC 1.7299 / I-0) TaxID=745776 RepID=H8GZP1_DEIGI|nr:PLP-dependent aminotransferase family protein [Deinococcus gobiensis]AFD25010.1 MocR protein [Deinococcus gobiensis I-0]